MIIPTQEPLNFSEKTRISQKEERKDFHIYNVARHVFYFMLHQITISHSTFLLLLQLQRTKMCFHPRPPLPYRLAALGSQHYTYNNIMRYINAILFVSMYVLVCLCRYNSCMMCMCVSFFYTHAKLS